MSRATAAAVRTAWVPASRSPVRSSTVTSSLASAAAPGLDDAAAEEVVGVFDAAAELPPPRDAVAPVDDVRAPARRPHARGDGVGIAEDLRGALRGQPAGEQAAGRRDRHAPPGRS